MQGHGKKRRNSVALETAPQQDPREAEPAPDADAQRLVNKQKVLVLSTRGINARARHLMEDFRNLLPHSKREGKLEAKDNMRSVNELCEIDGCNKIVLFDTKRGQDLYVHMACSPHGPSIKFHATNIHTMLELNFSGNHLKGSRPIVTFDAGFSSEPHWKLIREVLQQIFVVPRKHKKSKPFVDHVLSFSKLDESVWMRNYQITRSEEGERILVEVGPRIVLNPIRVFEGSLGGPTLWKNPTFVPPNVVRRERQMEADTRLASGRIKSKKGKEKLSKWFIPESEYDKVVKDTAGDLDLDDFDDLLEIGGDE